MVTAIYAFGAWLAASLLARVLVGAGLAITSYTFIDGLIDNLATSINNKIGSYAAVDILMLAGFGEAMSIILSAMAAVLVIKSVKFGLVRK